MSELKPVITNKMKAENHGYHSIKVWAICGECQDVEPDPDCCLCGGDIDYEKDVEVPWTVCKEIYKAMFKSSDIQADMDKAIEQAKRETAEKCAEELKGWIGAVTMDEDYNPSYLAEIVEAIKAVGGGDE